MSPSTASRASRGRSWRRLAAGLLAVVAGLTAVDVAATAWSEGVPPARAGVVRSGTQVSMPPAGVDVMATEQMRIDGPQVDAEELEAASETARRVALLGLVGGLFVSAYLEKERQVAACITTCAEQGGR